ncbi:hypothetical protein PZB75_06530 [Streptomyces sp. AM 4-1-1]|uniref:helix-turn-helix transcriptional regulator n=1 Tax=unclassified Streptomyces TaxID=2593676 RepID=UPI0023B9BD13|nr:hypothetical protein [Streptomyces sp. AM 4-1-1]WEH33062.1 hypothetical protein PZB75_06530 [Streptomyces sp. AM 4-1-1]
MEFEFSFIVDGISVDDEAVGVLYENYDALLLSQGGRSVLVITGEGQDAVQAAHAVIGSLKTLMPQVSVMRLDADLVGVADIADRVQRSRQNVAQWVNGERNAGGVDGFPSPEGTIGRSHVWRWAEVNEWLSTVGLGDGIVRPNREQALIIDLMITQWLRAMKQGRPALEIIAEQDDRANDRVRVMNLLGEAMQDSAFIDQLASLPRKDPHRLKVVCAVLLDPLSKIIGELGSDELSGALAVISDEGELHMTPIAATPLPGTVPAASIGLGPYATVGDLVLLQRNGTVDRETPLSLDFV